MRELCLTDNRRLALQPILIVHGFNLAPAAAGCPSQIEPRTTQGREKGCFLSRFYSPVLFAGFIRRFAGLIHLFG
jgi:hypothetical protein